MHRLNVEDFAERTQPIVMPPSPEPEPARSVIHGDTAWDRLVIALCLVGVIAGLAVLTGCGGSEEPEPDWGPDVSVAQCAVSPTKPTHPVALDQLVARCKPFVDYQCRNGGEIPTGWRCVQ